MIVVTGATGRLGGLIVDRLREQRPADELGVSVRDPQKALALAGSGGRVRVRAGGSPGVGGLAASFEGARTVLLVSASTFGDEAVRQHAPAIEAAKRAGVERVVY